MNAGAVLRIQSVLLCSRQALAHALYCQLRNVSTYVLLWFTCLFWALDCHIQLLSGIFFYWLFQRVLKVSPPTIHLSSFFSINAVGAGVLFQPKIWSTKEGFLEEVTLNWDWLCEVQQRHQEEGKVCAEAWEQKNLGHRGRWAGGRRWGGERSHGLEGQVGLSTCRASQTQGWHDSIFYFKTSLPSVS